MEPLGILSKAFARRNGFAAGRFPTASFLEDTLPDRGAPGVNKRLRIGGGPQMRLPKISGLGWCLVLSTAVQTVTMLMVAWLVFSRPYFRVEGSVWVDGGHIDASGSEISTRGPIDVRISN